MREITPLRPEKLDYEFIAHYQDGRLLKQEYNTPNEKNFGDIEHDKLVVFGIYGKGKHFEVNLNTGVLNLNGLPIRFDLGVKRDKDGTPVTDADGNTVKLTPDKFDLIYFRRIQNVVDPNKGTVTIVTKYLLGWQTKIDGKNYQRFVILENDGSLTISENR